MYESVANCFFMRFSVHNEIHNPLGADYNPGKVKQVLRAQMHLNSVSVSVKAFVNVRALRKLSQRITML